MAQQKQSSSSSSSVQATSPSPSLVRAEQVLKELSAATISGIVSSTVGHPLDTVKVKLQTQNRGPSVTTNTAVVNQQQYRSGLDCFVSIVKNEGVMALFRGLKPPLYACAFYNIITFGSLNQFKRMIIGSDDVSKATISQNAIAGALTGICLSAIMTPVDQIKTQLQVQQRQQNLTTTAGAAAGQSKQHPMFNSPSQLLRHIYQHECHGNMRSTFSYLMKAFPATFTREFYGSFVYFGTYAFMKEFLSSVWISQQLLPPTSLTGATNENTNTTPTTTTTSQPTPTDQFYMVEDHYLAIDEQKNASYRRELGASDFMISGAMSGMTYWLCVYPADVVKSRMHCGHQYSGVFSAMKQIAKQEGIRALYFGIQPTILRSLFSSGIMFACYEKTLEYLGGHSNKR